MLDRVAGKPTAKEEQVEWLTAYLTSWRTAQTRSPAVAASEIVNALMVSTMRALDVAEFGPET